MITIIAAISKNRVIGNDNKLIWHLPNDLKRFKEITLNHIIIMGRKTFESFPKPLPNRRHIVISRQEDYSFDGVEVVSSLEKALDISKNENSFIIGGGEIYNLALEYATNMELTEIDNDFDGDAYFPEFGEEWIKTNSIKNQVDDKHKYSYTYNSYKRK